MTSDLFTNLGGIEVANSYPERPGWKAEGTSRIAAESVKSRDAETKRKILAILKDRQLTSDELAPLLGETEFYTRPRVSQLVAKGLVVKSGIRRANSSGQMANVWRAI